MSGGGGGVCGGVCGEEPNSDGTKDQNTPPDVRIRSLGDEVGLVTAAVSSLMMF